MIRMCAVVIIFYVVSLALIGCASNERFDNQKWKDASGQYCDAPSPRDDMIEDLTSLVLKLGMSQKDVMKLLGSPDRRLGPKAVEYYLGPDSIGIDCEILDLEFSGRGRLTSWGVWEN